MLAFLLPCFAMPAGATIIAPAPELGGGTITNERTGTTYTNLGTAISAAAAGDTLRLSSGVYEGYVEDLTEAQK